jgi:hypothetical protein
MIKLRSENIHLMIIANTFDKDQNSINFTLSN